MDCQGHLVQKRKTIMATVCESHHTLVLREGLHDVVPCRASSSSRCKYRLAQVDAATISWGNACTLLSALWRKKKVEMVVSCLSDGLVFRFLLLWVELLALLFVSGTTTPSALGLQMPRCCGGNGLLSSLPLLCCGWPQQTALKRSIGRAGGSAMSGISCSGVRFACFCLVACWWLAQNGRSVCLVTRFWFAESHLLFRVTYFRYYRRSFGWSWSGRRPMAREQRRRPLGGLHWEGLGTLSFYDDISVVIFRKRDDELDEEKNLIHLLYGSRAPLHCKQFSLLAGDVSTKRCSGFTLNFVAASKMKTID